MSTTIHSGENTTTGGGEDDSASSSVEKYLAAVAAAAAADRVKASRRKVLRWTGIGVLTATLATVGIKLGTGGAGGGGDKDPGNDGGNVKLGPVLDQIEGNPEREAALRKLLGYDDTTPMVVINESAPKSDSPEDQLTGWSVALLAAPNKDMEPGEPWEETKVDISITPRRYNGADKLSSLGRAYANHPETSPFLWGDKDNLGPEDTAAFLDRVNGSSIVFADEAVVRIVRSNYELDQNSQVVTVLEPWVGAPQEAPTAELARLFS